MMELHTCDDKAKLLSFVPHKSVDEFEFVVHQCAGVCFALRYNVFGPQVDFASLVNGKNEKSEQLMALRLRA